jgi:bacteriochlorophyll 4-vinyl reductase
MSESGVGRVLVASLHQAIGEVLPMRLAFYEGWLNAEGLRDGTIGLAPLYAVLSFLRQEGDDAYATVTTKAGEYAAEWTVESMRPFRRRFIGRLPGSFRRRLLLDHAKSLVRMSYDGSRASWRIRRGNARIAVRGSVFCSVREPASHPLCGYYAAACERMLSMFELAAPVTVESCKATGAEACVLTIPFTATSASERQEVE